MEAIENNERITIDNLSRDEANDLIKKLSGGLLANFEKAFHGEKENMEKGYSMWALPDDKRIYYLVSMDGIHYLIVGVNPNPTRNAINISSLARIGVNPRGSAAECLRKLIEDKLIPKCQEEKREAIVAWITTDCGLKVFKALGEKCLQGVKEITLNRKGIHWSWIMKLG